MWLKSNFFEILEEKSIGNFRNFEIFEIFAKKLEMFRKFWPKSKFLENLTKIKILEKKSIRKFWLSRKFFENLTKIEVFLNFDQNWIFSKIWKKSIRKFWLKSKIFDNLTEIEIF